MDTNYQDFDHDISEIVDEALRRAYEMECFEGMSEGEYLEFVASLTSVAIDAARNGEMEDAKVAVDNALSKISDKYVPAA